MSVSQSSLYEHTPALREIEEELEQSLESQSLIVNTIHSTTSKAKDLSISESYRMIVFISKNLQNNYSVEKKFLALLVIKQLLLTGCHRFYIFSSIRILPWLISTANFQPKKTEHQRVRAYLQQLTIGGNGEHVVQERYSYKLFKIVSEFIHWFSEKLPQHLNCPYSYRSTFKRSLEQLSQEVKIRNFQYFSEEDFQKFQKNVDLLEAQSSLQIKDLTEFIIIEINTLIQKKKVKSDLLTNIIKTGDSFCIHSMISEIKEILQDPSKIGTMIKLFNNFMNVGDVQFVQMAKIYCVPYVIQYILQINLIEGRLLRCSKEEQQYMIKSIYLWHQITKKLGLSTKLYETIIKLIEKAKKQKAQITLQDLSQFNTNLLDMHSLNSDKLIAVSLNEKQNQIINILTQKTSQKSQKFDVSAINELSQFKQSKVDDILKFDKSSVSRFSSSAVKSSFQGVKVGKNPSIKESKAIQQKQKRMQQFYDEKVIPKKQINSKVLSKNDSYVAFEPSQSSKYSVFSKKSQNFIDFSNSSASKEQSSDPSVVYFNNSDSFNSIHEQSKTTTKKQPSSYQGKLKQSKSSEKKQIYSNDSKFIQSTYSFANTLGSTSSLSEESSKIVDFGKIGNNLPQIQRKPDFGFKKAKIKEEEARKKTKQKYQNVLDNIFSSRGSVRRALNINEHQESDLTNQGLRGSLDFPKSIDFKSQDFENGNDWQREPIDIDEEKFSEIVKKSKNLKQTRKIKQSQIKVKKRPLLVEEFDNDKLLQLQKEIGKEREEKQKKKRQLKKKEKQYYLLRQKSDPTLNSHMKQLKKQNQLLQLLQQDKDKEQKKQVDKIIKPMGSNNQIQDFFLQNKVKGVYSVSVIPYDKIFLKQILGSRCLLVKNENIELGFNYSQRENTISLYLTLLKAFDTVEIRVTENSLAFDKQILMRLKNQPARSQLKIKRNIYKFVEKKKVPTFSQIVSENSNNVFEFPEIYVGMNEEKEPLKEYSSLLPCSLFNLCPPIELSKQIILGLKEKKVIKTDRLLLSPEFAKNTKEKLHKYFGSYMNLVGGWKIIGFHYPEEIFQKKEDQFFKFRINELKQIQFEFFGDPQSLLAEALLKILASPKK